MFLTDKKIVPALLALLILFSIGMLGCGLRESQTGSLSSRIIDADGNAVLSAEIYSIFRESEKVFSSEDGGFYLAELPAGINNIVIIHPDYQIEERQIEILSDETTELESIRLDNSNAPHKISGIAVAETSSNTARIRWNTYRSVACNVDYGVTQSYGGIYREERAATEHEILLTGLSAETLYHFRVQYIDESSISHYSYDYSFKTEMGDRPSAPLSIDVLPIEAAGTVNVVWQAATASSVIGYNIYRMEKGGDWKLLNERPTSPRTVTYSDATANAGTFTKYAVVAVNEFIGESEKIISQSVFVPGVISGNLKIAYLDSPINLSSDLVIAAGTTLEVEPGVVFQIGEKDLSSTGMDEKRVEIIVSGRLVLLGTAENPVKFIPLNGSGSRDHWAGINILSSATGLSKLEYVQIFGCKGYSIEVEATRTEIKNINISYSENGLRLSGVREALVLDSCHFSEISETALKVESCRKVTVSNSMMRQVKSGIVSNATTKDDEIIVSNTDLYCVETGISGVFGRSTMKNALVVVPDGIGISMSNIIDVYGNFIDHCTIDASNGIEVASGVVTIENNVVINKSAIGVKGINNSSILTPAYQFNNVFGFKTLYEGCGPGVGGVSAEPEFTGGNPFDYNLLPRSPLNLQDKFGSELGRYGVTHL